MPWKIPEDLAWFKQNTLGHPIIMGKNTWKSIGKALPDRQNIILSKDTSFHPEGAIVVHNMQEMLPKIEGEEVFVIGGASVFAQFLPWADRLLITLIHSKFEGDTYFPPFNEDEWLLQDKKDIISSTGYPLSFLTYIRKENFKSEK
ncbi:MAG: dihydrofolate reductase [Candidatus Cloacimonas sp.]